MRKQSEQRTLVMVKVYSTKEHEYIQMLQSFTTIISVPDFLANWRRITFHKMEFSPFRCPFLRLNKQEKNKREDDGEEVTSQDKTKIRQVQEKTLKKKSKLPPKVDLKKPKCGFAKLRHPNSSHGNNNNQNLTSDAIASAANLFGSDLTMRCGLEKKLVPNIVSRCIEEIELRGMDVEGIYRKSGGSGQINQIRMGFEQSNEYDISDPDLDIHAVTSTLKQYFRRLPTPLITFDVYDSLLEATKIEDDTRKALKMKDAINTLPRCHRDCLKFLISHLCRVLARADVNLVCTYFSLAVDFSDMLTDTFQMTSLNLALVFAPTIMRSQSIEREMNDIQTLWDAVQSMLEYCKIIFNDNEVKIL
jgi:hypothetical protein